MHTWIDTTIAIMALVTTWLFKWQNWESRIPESAKSASKSSVYIRKYKTGIVIVALLTSVSTLAYLIFNTLPNNKMMALLIAVNVSSIFMAVLSWILMINNERLKKLIAEEGKRARATAFALTGHARM
jgi:hypothetical protein